MRTFNAPEGFACIRRLPPCVSTVTDRRLGFGRVRDGFVRFALVVDPHRFQVAAENRRRVTSR